MLKYFYEKIYILTKNNININNNRVTIKEYKDLNDLKIQINKLDNNDLILIDDQRQILDVNQLHYIFNIIDENDVEYYSFAIEMKSTWETYMNQAYNFRHYGSIFRAKLFKDWTSKNEKELFLFSNYLFLNANLIFNDQA